MLDRWALEIENRSDATVEDHQRAQRYLEDALSLEPGYAGHWLLLGRLRDLRTMEHPLRIELTVALAGCATSRRRTCWRAARTAARSRSRRPSPSLASYMSYRLGYIEWADSLFREAIPLLSGDLRALMDDPLSLLRTPVKSDSATEAAGGSADTLRSSDSAAVVEHAPIPFAALPFPAPPGDPGAASLAELDPDPTTPQTHTASTRTARSLDINCGRSSCADREGFRPA